MKKRRLIHLVLLHCVLPLFAGLMIYLFLRKSTWINELTGLEFSSQKDGYLLSLVKYTLPDFFWDYSFGSALFIYKLSLQKPVKYFSILVLFLLLATEAVQYFFPSRFTFDLVDLGAALIAFILSYLFIKQQMKKLTSKLILPAILAGYCLLYMATSVEKDCINCAEYQVLNDSLRNNRPYVLSVNNCGVVYSNFDTLCIRVKDTTGINWMKLADTTCYYTKQQDLHTKRVYIIQYNTSDTLAAVSCP